ncbi:MAG: hypothetical protein QNJ44_16185 [Rhodobacter sp.]|nr:hypothetical protein [Rhodobacter sp.]
MTVNVTCIDASCADLPYGRPVMSRLTEAGGRWELTLGPASIR